nr:DUF5674 family protein [Nodosilinea sp. LEGE 07298]
MVPLSQTVGYESLINIRPSANNGSMMIQDSGLRDDIRQLVQSLMGDV